MATGELRLDSLLGSAAYDSIGQRRWENVSPNGVYATRWMEYNHKNERTGLFSGTANLSRQFMYDEASHLIGEYNLNGTPIVEYVWLGDKPVATLYPNGRIVYLITDHQNKPRRGYDAALGRYVWSWDADAFGVKAATAEAGVVQNLRFPGHEEGISGALLRPDARRGLCPSDDVATGLHYNHNRFYNPKLGRYMEPDPIKLAGGNNPYAYVGNDPVNSVDPTGLWSFSGAWDSISTSWSNFWSSSPPPTMQNDFRGIPQQWQQPIMLFTEQASVKMQDGGKDYAMALATITPLGEASAFFAASKIWSIPSRVMKKFPSSWGDGLPNKKGIGMRWQDPANRGNGVRIDQGNPNNSQVVQQVDHVVVRYNGQVIGKNGQPIQGSIKQNPTDAHIPLSDYAKWRNWNSP